jgi:hypothetical protein
LTTADASHTNKKEEFNAEIKVEVERLAEEVNRLKALLESDDASDKNVLRTQLVENVTKLSQQVVCGARELFA